MNFLRRIFYNMYGMDKMGYFTILTSIVLNLLGSLFKMRLFIILGEIIFLYSAFRFISNNKAQRFKENQKFLKIYEDVKRKLRQNKARISDKKNNYFRCPKCKTYLSVPKGVGKVCIVCRKCNHQFIKKSK